MLHVICIIYLFLLSSARLLVRRESPGPVFLSPIIKHPYLPICLATSCYCTSELTLARIIILTGSEATRVPHGTSFCRIVGAFEDLVAQEFLLLLSHIFRYLGLNLMRAAGVDRVACIACM